MITCENKHFVLGTKNTTYAFWVLPTGQLEHLYYGKKIKFGPGLLGIDTLKEQWAFAPGNTVVYDNDHWEYTLENVRLEMSALGHGDYREPLVCITHADGGRTSDFLYSDFKVRKGRTELKDMPASYGNDDEVEELTIILQDKNYNTELELRYCVYAERDVITRTAVLKNCSKDDITVTRLMSMMLDMKDSDYDLTTFHGAWVREMGRDRRHVSHGKYVGGTMSGVSSNKCNPLMLLSKPGATQNEGGVYGFNLVYSGNHAEIVEIGSHDKLRVMSGIQPEGFTYLLREGESLEAPEAVMTYSENGFNGMSGNMHTFIRNHIVRGEWKNKVRPILLNSWEAAYFDINESKLVKLAKAAAKVGIELLVMDDGWFGERNDDRRSLGDWVPDKKKLPNGLKGLCDKINDAGVDFGIWVEPEMVNVDSNLYRAHPDWCLAVPGINHSEGRSQRVLDLCREDVQDYIIDAMSEVFGSANIAYVKWDMNRPITDYYSESLPAARQGEVAHRYVLGLYRIMKTLTEKFPHILFEGCSSGGNRFDLGILSYFPQIWGSDNTDAICRASIQDGYSYGYPPETIGAHVSNCPNHQTLRETPLETRFAIASFGAFGYECNLCDMGKEELAAIAVQVALYKDMRQTIQFGTMYRGRSFYSGALSQMHEAMDDNICEWTVVSPDKSKAIGMIAQTLVKANWPYQYYKPVGLEPDAMYHFSNRFLKHNIKEFGDLVNQVAPVHVRQDSLLHNVLARMIKMDGEKEDITAYGDVFMEAGINLKPGFGGTGYDDRVRFFPDFASRLYFMDKVEE